MEKRFRGPQTYAGWSSISGPDREYGDKRCKVQGVGQGVQRNDCHELIVQENRSHGTEDDFKSSA
jgi:hypothetical protein